MFALKIKTSVSTLQGVDNASRGDIRRKWRNEAVVPPPAPAPSLTIFPPHGDYFEYSFDLNAMVMNTGSY